MRAVTIRLNEYVDGKVYVDFLIESNSSVDLHTFTVIYLFLYTHTHTNTLKTFSERISALNYIFKWQHRCSRLISGLVRIFACGAKVVRSLSVPSPEKGFGLSMFRRRNGDGKKA